MITINATRCVLISPNFMGRYRIYVSLTASNYLLWDLRTTRSSASLIVNNSVRTSCVFGQGTPMSPWLFSKIGCRMVGQNYAQNSTPSTVIFIVKKLYDLVVRPTRLSRQQPVPLSV